MVELLAATPARYEEYNSKLNDHLAAATAVSRSRFSGAVTYGSGIWESVNWSEFNIVGAHMYRDASNAATYVTDLRSYRAWQKPIFILEFGPARFNGESGFRSELS